MQKLQLIVTLNTNAYTSILFDAQGWLLMDIKDEEDSLFSISSCNILTLAMDL